LEAMKLPILLEDQLATMIDNYPNYMRKKEKQRERAMHLIETGVVRSSHFFE
jgi:hypothetical protein